MKNISGIIAGTANRPMLYDLTFDTTVKNKALIVFIHGFKGFKDWGTFPLLANHFAMQGYPFLKFNLSHNGTTPNQPDQFSDLESFARNTISKELNDTNLLLQALLNERLDDSLELSHLPLVLMGHSRGGGIAALAAIENKSVAALITLASLSKYGNFFGEKRYAEWKEKGVMYVLNSRTGQQLPMYWQYMEDLESNNERLNIIGRVAGLKIPTLIIHGTADESVPIHHAQQLLEAIANSELLLIEGGNHTFGGMHPYLSDDLPRHTIEWTERALIFLNKHFNK